MALGPWGISRALPTSNLLPFGCFYNNYEAQTGIGCRKARRPSPAGEHIRSELKTLRLYPINLIQVSFIALLCVTSRPLRKDRQLEKRFMNRNARQGPLAKKTWRPPGFAPLFCARCRIVPESDAAAFPGDLDGRRQRGNLSDAPCTVPLPCHNSQHHNVIPVAFRRDGRSLRTSSPPRPLVTPNVFDTVCWCLCMHANIRK